MSAGAPDVVGGVEDLRAGGDEVLVGDRRADAGVALDEDLVAVADELVHAGRGDRDPVLVVLDLAGDADLHAALPRVLDGMRLRMNDATAC